MPGAAARLTGVVFVEDHVPRSALGAGYPRSLATLRALAEIADRVVVVATQPPLPLDVAPDLLPANVAVSSGARADPVSEVLVALSGGARLLWVARPNNMALVAGLRARLPAQFEGVRIVYDSEAVFAQREIVRLAVAGLPVAAARAKRMVRQELYPAEVADAAAAVSDGEAAILRSHLRKPVERLAYPAPWHGGGPSFAERRGALFVGAAPSPETPNGDSLRYLLDDIWPRLGSAAPALDIVGRGCEPDGWLAGHLAPGVRLHGALADPTALYRRARVFLAPTRFAAGIPIKVLDAARFGVPVVATSLLAGQLGWQGSGALAVADEPAGFAAAIAAIHGNETAWTSLRDGARAALARDFDPDLFRRQAHRLALG